MAEHGARTDSTLVPYCNLQQSHKCLRRQDRSSRVLFLAGGSEWRFHCGWICVMAGAA